ncbi:hypothetical protein [Rhizobium mesoamericanum]|nr:hypothetical protein [Rhizobium mesoamericanum]
MYKNHIGTEVSLQYYYMTEAHARLCAANRSLTGIAYRLLASRPANAPRDVVDAGLNWYIAVKEGAGDQGFDVISWGKAIAA